MTPMNRIDTLKVKLFADGADKASLLEMAKKPFIKGFTTNPTLMKEAGVTDFEAFAKEILARIQDRPVSLEVFADDFDEMEKQARKISNWAENVYVKIPVMNVRRMPSLDLVRRLSQTGVKINVTALLTLNQVRQVVAQVAGGGSCQISVFAGRIADTGIDPVPIMAAAVEALKAAPNAELIWASPRELLNVFQAEAVGCHIITATHDILNKLPLIGKDLEEFSWETVRMFHRDAQAAGFMLE